MEKMTLAEIGHAIREATRVSPDGELSEDSCAELDALKLSLDEKVEGYAYVGHEDRACAKALRDLAAEYTRRARVREAQAERRDERLLREMRLFGIEAIVTKTVTASIVSNPPAIDVADIGAVPDEYLVKREPALDARKALAAHRAGIELPWATITRGVRISWK
jgi:Siphovirus Gp157